MHHIHVLEFLHICWARQSKEFRALRAFGRVAQPLERTSLADILLLRGYSVRHERFHIEVELEHEHDFVVSV